MHYIEKCSEHGTVLGQCRCPSRDKAIKLVPCPSEPYCDTYNKKKMSRTDELEDALNHLLNAVRAKAAPDLMARAVREAEGVLQKKQDFKPAVVAPWNRYRFVDPSNYADSDSDCE